MSEWQPIETAPIETPVLVWAPRARKDACGTFNREDVSVVVAALRVDYFRKYPSERTPPIDPKDYPDKWYGDLVEFESGWESTGSYTTDIELEPTHWMPLPDPPQ